MALLLELKKIIEQLTILVSKQNEMDEQLSIFYYQNKK